MNEEELRDQLETEAREALPSDDAWERIDRRIRREPWRRASLLAAGLALAIAAAAITLPRVMTQSDEGRVATEPGATNPSPTEASGAGFAEAGYEQHFPGFWPADNYAEAKKMQADAEQGIETWRLEPADVVKKFSETFIGWKIDSIGTAEISGDENQGWTARTTATPRIGEGKGVKGRDHVVKLVGLAAEHPVWFVTSVESPNLAVESPEIAQFITSPVKVKGRGEGFEATILVEIRDDAGTLLYPREGKQEGYVMGGAYEPEPFEGDLTFDAPTAASGLVIFTSSTGLEGPSPDWTIVRVRFGN